MKKIVNFLLIVLIPIILITALIAIFAWSSTDKDESNYESELFI